MIQTFAEPTVLIDTWWNVNPIMILLVPASATGFNRYMVECEY